MKLKKCLNCSKEFRVYPKNETIRKYCSFLCRKSLYNKEIREKMSNIKKEQYLSGLTPWNRGKIMTKEYRDMISKTLIGKTGAESRNWKGGLSYFTVRATRKRENGGSHTSAQWETLKAQYNWTCPCCKIKEPIIKLVKDHVVPLAKGGSENIENIQPLCRSCNAKKHTAIIHYELVENTK